MDYTSSSISIIPDNILKLEENDHTFDEHMAEIKNAKQYFIETGNILPVVRKEIADSWMRCGRKSNLHLAKKTFIMPETELTQIQKENETLINVTNSIIESICKALKETNFVMWLTDHNCNIIYINDKSYLENALKNIDLVVGYCYDEQYAGTNSACLAIKTKNNVIVNGPEHFNISSSTVNCATALIHGISGDIIGTITITYKHQLHSRIIAGMILTAADLIEKELHMISHTRVLDYTINNISESVIVLDSKLKIKSVNESFLKLVKRDESSLRTQNMIQIFSEIDFDNWYVGNASTLILNEIILHISSSKKIRVKANVYFSYNNNEPATVVIICQKISDIIKLSHHYTKNISSFTFDDIITADKSMLKLIKDCKKVASLDHTVLLEGASGTGKELVAHSIHSSSPRKGKPFIAVNCAALPINLIESELFGYEKGSFSGALPSGKAGKFELANSGTIFLDEIGEIPLDMQAKLLRVLDNSRVTRIGGDIEIKLDIRIIAATNRNLYEETLKMNFREDLYYRLNVISLKLPSLNQRKADIPLLINFFIENLNKKNSNSPKCIDDESVDILSNRIWRGNIRELQNSITRAYYLCDCELITKDFFTDSFDSSKATIDSSQYHIAGSSMNKKELEKELIIKALKETGGNITAASELTQLSRATLYRKIKQYDISSETYK